MQNGKNIPENINRYIGKLFIFLFIMIISYLTFFSKHFLFVIYERAQSFVNIETIEYVTVLICIGILMSSILTFCFLEWKKRNHIVVIGTCVLTLAIDTMLFSLFPLRSKSYETVQFPGLSFQLIIEDQSYRITSFSLTHHVVLIATFVFFIFFSRFWKRSYVKINQYRYEFVFWMFSILSIIKNSAFPNVVSYPSTFYFKSYEFGFVKRGLIGNIFIGICPYITEKGLALFKIVFLLFFYFLLGIILGKCLKRQKDNRIRWFWVFLIIALPSTFINVRDDVRLDTFLVLIFISIVILISTGKAVTLIPILIVHMLLINETSCAFFIPPVLAMLFFKWVRKREKKYIISAITGLVFSFCICGIFLFRGDPWYRFDIEQIVHHIQNHSEASVAQFALEAEIMTIPEQLIFISEKNREFYMAIGLMFLSIIPIIILFVNIWVSFHLKLRKEKSIDKLSFWILAIAPFSAFATMIISWDYPRYIAFMIDAIILTIFFFVNEEDIQMSYADLSLSKKSNSVIPITICVFYFIFGVYGSTIKTIEVIMRYDQFISSIADILWGR